MGEIMANRMELIKKEKGTWRKKHLDKSKLQLVKTDSGIDIAVLYTPDDVEDFVLLVKMSDTSFLPYLFGERFDPAVRRMFPGWKSP
jgi:hypothetical protein